MAVNPKKNEWNCQRWSVWPS